MNCKTYNTKTGKEIRLWQGDCMELLDTGNHWDLAIVDPPYGIGRDGGETGKNWKFYKKKGWDSERPTPMYFEELKRVSKNQIIFGANYFTKSIDPSMGWVVWDKGQKLTMSDGELIYTSFDKALRIFEMNRCKIGDHGGNIHPTQKPIKLYRWLLQNYAAEGDTILDTHGGSMSLAIACYIEDYELDIIELDEDYYTDAVKRFDQHISQKTLF